MYSQYTLQPSAHMALQQPQVAPTLIGRHRSESYSEPSSPATSTHSTHSNGPAAGASQIGRPAYFMTGPHTGKTIRMELVEIQKADLGRKYAKVDRRPLDPPPVVLLKLYEVHTSSNGEQIEVEMAYDETHLLGLLCTVDLFPAPSSETESPKSHGRQKVRSAPPARTHFFSSASPSSSPSAYDSEFLQYRYQPERNTSSPTRLTSGYEYPAQGAPDIVHHLDGFPINENSKLTQCLAGATFVQPAIIDYQGSKAIVFVFADLAVKIEGTYFLRYRVFDIFGRQHNDELRVTAETYGGTFRVYSTKEFPGLAASTELTKLLARWGVRLNIRETERRRRKRPASEERQDDSTSKNAEQQLWL